MIRCLVGLLLVVCAMGCVSGHEDPSSTTPLRLRVLTYNIHHGEGVDGVFDYQRLADIINRSEPDLVALQEVDVKTGRSSGIDQAAKLGGLTGMHHHFAEAMPYDGGDYGEAILSRTPILGVEGLPLNAAPGQEPRVVAVAELDPWGDAGPVITFAGTHLCHQSAETRLSQARQVNHEVITYPTMPGIIAGDFNFTMDSRAYNEMATRWTDAALMFGDPRPTFPSDRPSARIDYVFVRPAGHWRVVEVRVLDEPVASDHASVLVELEYNPPAPNRVYPPAGVPDNMGP